MTNQGLRLSGPIGALLLLMAALPALAQEAVLAKSAKASCPSMAALSKNRAWVEHVGPLPQAEYDAHLNSQIDGVGKMLLPVDTVSYWVGMTRRGRGVESELRFPSCFVLGSAAFYVYGTEQDPAVDFEKFIGEGRGVVERKLHPYLIELRWYDAKDGRRHRWYNTELAMRVGWTLDSRGRPSDNTRPNPMPDTINELY